MADNVKNIQGISVDDGSVKESIYNKFGDEIGVFYFRPTDIGIIERYNKVANEFDKIVEPLKDIDVNADGTADEDDELSLEAMKKAEKSLYEACDYIFGGNMSEAFFGKIRPFSIINGRFYAENALEAVGNYISKRFERETKRVNSRVERYTQGYHSKKHKNRK